MEGDLRVPDYDRIPRVPEFAYLQENKTAETRTMRFILISK